jgi:hypothetical protein
MADENDLGRLTIGLKTGDEPFLIAGKPAAFDLKSFWQWSTSDLVNNSTRGVLAEYLVAQSLGLRAETPREPWARWDLETEDGIKIEVKSAALVQSWHQDRLSNPSFNYRATVGWDADTNRQSDRAAREADVYVFALLAHEHKPTINPLDLDQWRFYVAATRAIEARQRSQHSISLSSLERLCQDQDQPLWQGPLKFGSDLAQAIPFIGA